MQSPNHKNYYSTTIADCKDVKTIKSIYSTDVNSQSNQKMRIMQHMEILQCIGNRGIMHEIISK